MPDSSLRDSRQARSPAGPGQVFRVHAESRGETRRQPVLAPCRTRAYPWSNVLGFSTGTLFEAL